MPAKPHTTSAKVKRDANAKVFGNIPVESENLDFLYGRRHLATFRDGKWRDLKYVAEYFELQQAIWTTLDRIRERDGLKICKEVADRLVDGIVDSVAVSIENNEKRQGRAKTAGTGCDIDTAIKLLQRKDGATRADLNEADFRQSSMAAIKSAQRRDLKTRVVKKDGERTRYYASRRARRADNPSAAH
jgi:hypothetical protein